MQAAILQETSREPPDGSTRNELVKILHTARDPRNRIRTKVRGPGGTSQVDRSKENKTSEAWQKFESYYRMQLPLPAHELDALFETMQTALPVTFRLVTPSGGSRDSLSSRTAAAAFEKRLLAALATSADDAAEEVLGRLSCLDWYPAQAAWQIESSKRQMRSRDLRGLQALLVQAAEQGLISRQEAVSMVPALLLNVHPGDTVLDLCAAPGSKTGQLLELTAQPLETGNMSGNMSTGARPDGVVIANDIDRERLQMVSCLFSVACSFSSLSCL